MRADLSQLTRVLAAHAQEYDATGEWPQACLSAFGDAGGWRWGIPRVHGGLGLSPTERLEVYTALARGDMSTALFVTQHEGAADMLIDSGNEALKAEYLPRYARGEGLTTIGYAQLTTSRQGGPPALTARREGGDFVLDGVIPWATGALHVESVIAGAVLPDGQQVMLLLRLDTPGVSVEPPLRLLALDSSHTSLVNCTGAVVPRRFLVEGPSQNVLAGRSIVRALLVSATGIGLLAAMLDHLEEIESVSMPKGPHPSATLRGQQEALGLRLHALAVAEPVDTSAVEALRADVNDFLVRLAGILLVYGKGTGYLREQTPQRLAREAMFFCVWSAPDGVRRQTLDRLTGGSGHFATGVPAGSK